MLSVGDAIRRHAILAEPVSTLRCKAISDAEIIQIRKHVAAASALSAKLRSHKSSRHSADRFVQGFWSRLVVQSAQAHPVG